MIRPRPEHVPSPQSLDESAGAEHRRQLLMLNRERIEFAYVKAVTRGLDDPVILVLDLQDECAVEVSRLTGLTSDEIDQCREKCGSSDVVPTQIIAAPRLAVLPVVGPMTVNSPYGILKSSPIGTFRVIAIASGGNAFADFPLPPNSDSTDAYCHAP